MENYNVMEDLFKVAVIPTNEVVDEYIKWLSYKPQFEIDKIKNLNSKNISNLSLDEINEMKKYEMNEHFLNLLTKLKLDKCSSEEQKQINEYIQILPIEEIIINKLTKEELNQAKTKIADIKNLSSSELTDLLVKGKKQENLSAVDEYVLYTVSKIVVLKNIQDTRLIIDQQISENQVRYNKGIDMLDFHPEKERLYK